MVVLAAGAVTYSTAQWVSEWAFDESLLNRAHGLMIHLDADSTDPMTPISTQTDRLLRTDRRDRIYFRVVGANGEHLNGDAGLPLDESPTDVPTPKATYAHARATPSTSLALTPPEGVFYEADYDGERVRVVRLAHRDASRHIDIVVAETMHKRREAVRRLLTGFGAAAALLAVTAALAVRFGLPYGLAPLRRLEARIKARSGADLTPVDATDVPMEIAELVRALNQLFARLREAQDAQRHFLQDAAHQLRTPLAGLQIQLELLQQHHAGASHEAIESLRRSVGRVTRLTNQLLVLARAEAGTRQLNNTSAVELAPLIDDALEEWLRTADTRQIDLGVERDLVSIPGDPTLLRALIDNLVDNALKYTPPGGQVNLRCTVVDGEAEIEVSDTGPGVSEEARERVFTRFYRAPGAAAMGSGLGLPIAREIAEAHHGSIEIGSGRNGRGTCLRVRLPAQK